MRELYEDLKQMLINDQKEVECKKEIFKKEVKALTKDARRYRLQLNEYGKWIECNIKVIDKQLKHIKE